VSAILSHSKRMAFNFALLFSGNVLGQLFILAAMVHLARSLGPATFGLWNVAQALMLYLLRANEMGLEVAGIRAVARNPERLPSLVSTVVGLRIGLAVILFAAMILVVLAGLLPSGSQSLAMILSLAVFPTAVILEWVFEGQQSVVVVSVSRILKGVLFGVSVLLLVKESSQANLAGYCYVGSVALPTVFVALAAVRRHGRLDWLFRWSEGKQLFREALPIGIATLLSQYSLFAGTVILGYLSPSEEVGYYSVGQRLIVFVWAYGIVTSNRVVLPQLSVLFRNSQDEFRSFVKKFLRLLAIVSLPLAIAAIGGGERIITLLFGAQYRPSIDVFKILSLALVIGMVRSILEIGLIASNRQSLFMRGMTMLAALYTILTYVFFEQWGITGVAWAAVAAEGVYCLYLTLVFSYVSPLEVLTTLWKPAAAAAVVISALFASGLQSLLVVLPAGIGIYTGILVLTRGLTRKDMILFGRVLVPEKAGQVQQ
jgi:O-antigen/teichoic acid export membrane protein